MWSMRLLIGLVLIAGGLGCGRWEATTTHLEGRITVDGQTVKEGNVSFIPLEANHGRGTTAVISEGHYSARDVPLGKVRVHFNATRATGRTVIVSDTRMPEIVDVIPDKYRSGVEIEVAAGQVRLDFDLDSHEAAAELGK
jgi:hypothetical protein